MHKYYTGVGARNAPEDVLEAITKLAEWLHERGWILRTGDARGCDFAFRRGAGGRKSVFRPADATPEMMDIASQFHPAWDRCSAIGKQLHGRNVAQVLGPRLNVPSRFLVCWTADGCNSHALRTVDTGGTGTAISIASHYGIPVYNLSRPHIPTILKIFYENE